MNKFLAFILFMVMNFVFSQEQNIVPPQVDVVISETKESNSNNVDSLYTVDVKTSNLQHPKTFSEDFKNKYKGEDFDYSLTKPKKSIGERILIRILQFLEPIIGKVTSDFALNSDLLIKILKGLGILLGAFMLFFILRFFFDKNRRSIFGKRNAKLDIEAEQLHENIHEINFPEAILNFELKKDYRSAVRYQFLFLLKKLNTKQLITWNPEKTNRDYELEIKSDLKKQYARWSYIFEYVWYGEFDINEEQYLLFKSELETVKF